MRKTPRLKARQRLESSTGADRDEAKKARSEPWPGLGLSLSHLSLGLRKNGQRFRRTLNAQSMFLRRPPLKKARTRPVQQRTSKPPT